MSIPTGSAFARALEEAGVVSDLNSIMRIVIDINGLEARVYVERVGDKKLLDAFKGQLGLMLAEAAAAPESVRYWSPFPPGVLEDDWMQGVLRDCGLRIVEPGPWRDKHSRLYLVEDPGAPEDVVGRTVELTFDLREGTPVRVSQREVIA